MKLKDFSIPMLIIVLAVSAACANWDKMSGTKPQNTEASAPAAERSSVTVLAEHLRAPWAIAFSGDVIYISERGGNIVKIQGNKMTRQRVGLKKNVLHQGEGGFLGLVLAPDFSQSRQAYAYHTYEEGGQVLNRVVLLKENEDGWEEVRAIIENIPGGIIHNGGRMAIGPDKHLYITTGETGRKELAQNPDSLGGKILRVTLDGRIPNDNPFPGSYVYSYGHRNSQGIAWDEDGKMYSSEHGPSGYDEINIITAGGNYGWPAIMGDEIREGMITPIYHTGDVAIAPSGVDMDANNRLLVATLRGEKLYSYNPQQNRLEVVLENEGRLRDVKIYNGKVYVITSNTDGRGTPSETDDRLLEIR